MIILKIELQNFRPFYGKQTIDLTPIEGRPVILVEALNDVGKTSLFRAIQFCLYGVKKTELPRHINRLAALEDNGETYVKLIFNHDEYQYEIIRSIKFKKNNKPQELPELINNDEFTITKDGAPQKLESIEERNEYIEAILPENASRFFLFDGEKIQIYTQHPPEDRIKEAVEMVLGIRELLNAGDDLEKLEAELRRELTALLRQEATDQRKAEELGKLETEIREIEHQIRGLEEQIAGAQEMVEQTTAELSKKGSIREKVQQRLELENRELPSIKTKIDANIQNLRDFNRNLGLLFISPFLEVLGGETKVTKAAPREWERVAADEILAKGQCICGKPIDVEVRRKLEPLITRPVLTTQELVQQRATELIIAIEPRSLHTAFIDLIEDRTSLESRKRGFVLRINELGKEIGDVKDSDIKSMEQIRDRAKEDIHRKTGQKDEKNRMLDEKKHRFSLDQKELAGKTVSQDVKQKEAMVKTCHEVFEALKEAREQLVKSRQREVEKLASGVFKRLTNNPDLYEGIVINDEYELMIKTVGSIVRPVWTQDPSAGASQVIATSFIAALNKFAAREAPVVIDTPIGRLDPIHKENIINFYPDIGPQVVILYQPHELTKYDIDKINKSVASTWILERDSSNPDITRIKKARGSS